KILIKQRPCYVGNISFKQIPGALKGSSFSETDITNITELCKSFAVAEKKQDPAKSRYAEYHLPHPIMPGKTIQPKDIALPPVTEQKIMAALDHVMKTEKLEVAEKDEPKTTNKKKRSK